MSDTKLTYVTAGEDQFGESHSLGVSVIRFKVTSPDGNGPLVLENEFHARGGPARHLHHDQDEWFYIIAGEFLMEVGDARFTLRPGDAVLAPRRVPHVWACVGDGHGRILVAFYPAGRMEAFFRAVTPAETMPRPDPALWEAHGMTLLGPPLAVDGESHLAIAHGNDVAPSLQLREVAQSDLPYFFEQQRDPLGVHMAAFTTQDPDDRAAFDAHWRRLLDDPTILMRTIEVDGQPAGHVSSYVGDLGLEVTYWLGRDFWGRGIATTALAKFLTRHQMQRPLYARAAADNTASIRVLEKCSFVLVGRDRGYANARRAEIDEVVMELT